MNMYINETNLSKETDVNVPSKKARKRESECDCTMV